MKSVAGVFKQEKNRIGERITPIYLYSIRYDAVSNSWLRWTDFASAVTFDSITYEPQVIKHNFIKESLSGKIERVRINIGNLDSTIQYYLDTYDGLRGKYATIKLVWNETLDDSNAFLEDEFSIQSSKSDRKQAQLILSSNLDVVDVKLPRCVFSRYRCRFIFKGSDCGYSGAESSCDNTFKRCQEIGNTARFGGFPGIPPRLMVLK